MNGAGFRPWSATGTSSTPTGTGTLEPESQPVPGSTNARSSDARPANVGAGASPAQFSAKSSRPGGRPRGRSEDNTTGSKMVELGLSGSLGSGESHRSTTWST